MRTFALFLLSLALISSLGILAFSSAGPDDAHITYWPAYTLRSFGEITNYNGERVEQSSSLLHVLAIAALSFTGLRVETAGALSTILFGALTLVAAAELGRSWFGGHPVLIALVVGSFPYFAYWSVGGLETTLTAWTAVLVVLVFGSYVETSSSRSQRYLFVAFVAVLLFAMSRPEMPLVAIAVALGAPMLGYLMPAFRAHLRPLVELSALTLASVALLFVARIVYFHELFPQPVIAKQLPEGVPVVAVLLERLGDGHRYLMDSAANNGFVFLLATMILSSLVLLTWSFLARRNGDPYSLFALLISAVCIGFILLSGGDWMPNGRFLVPLVPIFALVLLLAISRFLPTRKQRVMAVSAIVFLNLGGIAYSSLFVHGVPIWRGLALDREMRAAYGRAYDWFERANPNRSEQLADIYYLDWLIEQLLERSERVVIQAGQMGIVPYHLSRKHYGRVRFLDRFALVERSFTSCDLTSAFGSSPNGLRVPSESYYPRLEELRRRCGIPVPDVIWEWSGRQDIVDGSGYTLLDTGTKRFLAVRDDLYPSLDPIPPSPANGHLSSSGR